MTYSESAWSKAREKMRKLKHFRLLSGSAHPRRKETFWSTLYSFEQFLNHGTRQQHASRLKCFETDAHTQETACPKILRQNWQVPYSVIQTNKGNVNRELDDKKRLNWILPRFPSAQYQTEELKYLLAWSGDSITLVPQRICPLKRRYPRWQVIRMSELD